MGVVWCGEVADAETALEHSSQAVRYLLVGKDDCVRKATKAAYLPSDCSAYALIARACSCALATLHVAPLETELERLASAGVRHHTGPAAHVFQLDTAADLQADRASP
jgi:hypothetical protein